MRSPHLIRVLLALVFLVLAACQPSPPETPPQEEVFTQAAQTFAVRLTQEAPTVEPTRPVPPTSTPRPTETPPPSPTPLPTATPEPTETAAPTPTATSSIPAGRLIFDDDFRTQRGWWEETNERWSMQFVPAGYQMIVNTRGATIWSTRSEVYEDMIVEASAYLADGPETGHYGVVCRHVDSANYYAFLASPGGSYGIVRMLQGELEFIAQGKDEDGEVINSDDDSNLVRGDCIGDSLTLYVNGERLLDVEDSSLEEGEAGVAVKAHMEDGVEVIFDSFALRVP